MSCAPREAACWWLAVWRPGVTFVNRPQLSLMRGTLLVLVQNTFKMPDAAPDAEPSDALPSLALPTDGSERRRSNSLWSRLSPARVREAGLEWARKDSFASTMSNAPSVVSATHKGSDREEAAGTVRDDGASVCTAAESAESQTKKEGGGKGDDLSKHHSDSGEGIFLDPARAAQLKTVFLQMADFYLSICYHLGSLFTKEKEKNFEDRQHVCFYGNVRGTGTARRLWIFQSFLLGRV